MKIGVSLMSESVGLQLINVIFFIDDKDVQKGDLSTAYIAWWVCLPFGKP